MVKKKFFWLVTALLWLNPAGLLSQSTNYEPVTPHASPEARALLKLMYDISGRYMLTGQHNYPNIKDRNSRFAAGYIGKTPVIFSTDWGFARDGDTDSYLARPDIVREAIRQHKKGSLITICWHAVPPTADEPVTFRPQPGADPDSLASVQGQLQDRQFRDILTPGTVLHQRWCNQVDSIAKYLKQLEQAHVPVLWRPYHEMNGEWFWWGGLTGKQGTAMLYRQLFDRLVHYHGITNLVWMWSVDRFHNPGMYYSNYYPGNQYLDILALDVYGNDFSQVYYDSLLALSCGKPMVLAEVGNPPSIEILDRQPKWGFYVIWAGMVRNTLKNQYHTIVSDPRVLSLEDTAYRRIINPFRLSCGLEPLSEKIHNETDFTGEWIINEEKSNFGHFGASAAPYKMNIVQDSQEISIKRTIILEYTDDRIIEEKLSLDSLENRGEFMNFPRITTAHFNQKGDTLIIHSRVSIQLGTRKSEMITKEIWTIRDGGKTLFIHQQNSSFRGEWNITMVFNRQ